jgi:hypothetical protein
MDVLGVLKSSSCSPYRMDMKNGDEREMRDEGERYECGSCDGRCNSKFTLHDSFHSSTLGRPPKLLLTSSSI